MREYLAKSGIKQCLRVTPFKFSFRQKQMQKAKLEKVFMYDCDIVCLPCWYAKNREPIKIPRNWDDLSKHGLIGKSKVKHARHN